MRCMFDFLNIPYVVPRAIYDSIITKSCKMIHIHVEYHRGNKIFKPIRIAEHIFLSGPIIGLEAIMDRS